jgi:hypothetical protein
VSGITEEGAWLFWFFGAFFLTLAFVFVAADEDSKWRKPIFAVWCAWTLPPFVAAWVRLVLS